ncbi:MULTISPECIES: hypothetical protein [unclassified Knoellia]|uniref:hypothetical protein n=1 Tax=Knoellia altitudinis TaxID=3404795 RepID=UPI0036230374
MSDSNTKALKVGWGSAVTVAVVAAALISFVADIGPVRTLYFRLADDQPRLGWGLLLVLGVVSAIGLTWQRRWLRGRLSDAKGQHETDLNELRQKVSNSEARTEKAEVALAEAQATVDALRQPRRVKADVALVEKTLGELGEGGRTRGAIVEGELECKYFDGWLLDTMDEFRHEAPETIQRLKDVRLREDLGTLYAAIEEFRGGMFEVIFRRRASDPGHGEFMIVQPPEGPWASERSDAPWEAYYTRVRGMQAQLGQIKDALIQVERRLHDLRVDYSEPAGR